MNTLPSRVHDSQNGLNYTPSSGITTSPILKLKAVSLSANSAEHG